MIERRWSEISGGAHVLNDGMPEGLVVTRPDQPPFSELWWQT